MVEERNKQWNPQRRQGRGQGTPVLEVNWDPLERAADNTYSTIIRIGLSGWWEGGRPTEARLSISQRGEEPQEFRVTLQQGRGTYPMTGLLPERHYHITVRTDEREVHKLLVVPALPKPKRPEEEEGEVAQLRLKKVQAEHQIQELTKRKPPKKLYVTFTGKPGRQKLIISVSADDGSLISGFIGTVVNGGRTETFRTDPDGTAIYPLNFREEDHYVEVRAGNEHDLIWRAVLVGPRATTT